MVGRVSHGSKVNHVYTCQDGFMLDYGIMLLHDTMIYKMFHLTSQYSRIPWLYDGGDMVFRWSTIV